MFNHHIDIRAHEQTKSASVNHIDERSNDGHYNVYHYGVKQRLKQYWYENDR